MKNIFNNQKILVIYSGALTVVLGVILLTSAIKPAPNANFNQINVRRINIVEPNGLTRMVIADNAEFPGAYYMGKEYPRNDRDATGMIFNDEEGTENGGLIFGGKKDKKGLTHSYGHLSFDEYQRDQLMVMESSSDGPSRDSHYQVNDDDRPYPITPTVVADWQKVVAQPAGPKREAATKAWHAKYPGGIVNRAFLGRNKDRSVSLSLKDVQGRERLVARVLPDGTPVIEFLDAEGKVVKTIGADAK